MSWTGEDTAAAARREPTTTSATECDDLLAVARTTGAGFVFGHSYGGLIAPEVATRSQQFSRVAVYEPGVSINGSINGAWLSDSERLLAEGDPRGAFTAMVRQAGYAPKLLSMVPFPASRAILRLGIRPAQWSRIEPHLQAQIAEHAQVVERDNSFRNYGQVTAKVLLLAGSKSSTFASRDLQTLQKTIPASAVEILRGTNHGTPTDGPLDMIGRHLISFFS